MKQKALWLFILFSSALLGQPTYINTVDNAVFGSLNKVVAAGNSGHVLFSLDQGYMVRYNRCGEEMFSRRIIMPGTPSLNDFISLSNGDFALLAASANATRDAIVARLDSSGNVLWVQQFRDANGDLRQFPYSIMETTNGSLCIFANLESISTLQVSNMLLWMDAQGNFTQAQTYNLGGIWGGAIATRDNGILFRTGNRLVKTDNTGLVEWAKSYNLGTTASDFRAPVELENGYAFCGRFNGSNLITLAKLDANGNLDTTRRLNQRGVISTPAAIDSNSFLLVANLEQAGGQVNMTVLRFNGNDLDLEGRTSLLSNFQGSSITVLPNQQPVASGTDGFFPQKSFSAAFSPDLFISCTQISTAVELVGLPSTSFDLNVSTATLTINTIPFVATIQNPNLNITKTCEPDAQLSLGPDTTICEGSAYRLRNVFSSTFDAYSWSTGENTPSILVSDSGTYWVEVILNCGQGILRDTFNLDTRPNPEFELGGPLFICEGENVLLEGPDCIGCDYFWSNGRSSKNIVVENPGNYSLTVQNANGCERQDFIEVRAQGCSCDFFMPNAFSPNGDGRNESIGPVFNCDLNDFKYLVFDRWGQLVFDSRSPQFQWDGKVDSKTVGPGIYMYAIEYTPVVQGEVQDRLFRRGYITLMR